MAASSGLGADVERFVAQHIQSIEQLEVLLLLVRTAPRDWTADAIAAELRVAAPSVTQRLQDLERRNLVVQARAAHRYNPQIRENAVILKVADANRERRVALIAFIFSKQTSSIQALADAFRVK